jgi:hypothetical protein
MIDADRTKSAIEMERDLMKKKLEDNFSFKMK